MLFVCPCLCIQSDSLLGFLNDQDVRDGISGKRDKSVDGLPLTDHLEMISKIASIAQSC